MNSTTCPLSFSLKSDDLYFESAYRIYLIVFGRDVSAVGGTEGLEVPMLHDQAYLPSEKKIKEARRATARAIRPFAISQER
jgi:hypothetical protein